MKKTARSRALLAAVSMAFSAVASADGDGSVHVTADRCGERVVVTISNQPFAEYRTAGLDQPSIWPIYNADGEAMTRSYPLGPMLPAEQADHPHHGSLWFAHGGVNGHDFWRPRDSGEPERARRIVHRVYHAVTSGEVATVESSNDWVSGSGRVCSDTRRCVFGQTPQADGPAVRWIDYTVTLHASEGDVEFADTKEGTLGFRVPGAMKADAGYGGVLSTTDGATGAEAWAKTTPWALYAGPSRLDGSGDPAGDAAVTLMNHPESAGGPCRWHIRTYGLFAANPFGETEFTSDPRDRPRRLARGESLTLRYRIALLANPPADGVVDSLYREFAAEPIEGESPR